MKTLVPEIVLDMYLKDNMSMSEISRVTKISEFKIKSFLLKNNVSLAKRKGKFRKLSQDDIQDIVNMGLSRTKRKVIEDKYGLYRSLITKILKEHDADIESHQSKFSLDVDYFENIDTKEKAMMFGLMYSDGYNQYDAGVISFGLTIEDIETVRKFKEIIKTDKPLEIITNNRGYSGEHFARIRVGSRKMSGDLNKHGCVQCKSLVKQFPHEALTNDELIKSFIYGYFLGNGSISYEELKTKTKGNYKNYRVAFYTNIFMARTFKEIFKKLGFHTSISKHDLKTNAAALSMSGNQQIKKFMDWLFKDEIYMMKRKTDLYLGLVDFVNNRK